MKLQFLTQNISNPEVLQQGMALVASNLNKINFSVDIIQQDINQIFTTEEFSTPAIGNGYCVIPQQIQTLAPDADVAFLVMSNATLNPKPLNPLMTHLKNPVPAQMFEEWYVTYPEVFCEYALHELAHIVYFLLNQTDITHLLTDETLQAQYPELFNQWKDQPHIDFYLYLLQTSGYNSGMEHPMIAKWCDGIKQYEGYIENPPSTSFRNNNPGNIRYIKGSIFSVGATCSPDGFCIYPDYNTGYNMLTLLLTRACTGQSSIYKPTMTLIDFYNIYAPSDDGNDPTTYATWIANYLQVPISTPIGDFIQ